MAENLSKGPLRVMTGSVAEINNVLAEVQVQLDSLAGLSGRSEVFDRVGVSAATEAGDAVNLGGFNVPTQPLPVRYTDSEGNLVHAFGSTT